MYGYNRISDTVFSLSCGDNFIPIALDTTREHFVSPNPTNARAEATASRVEN